MKSRVLQSYHRTGKAAVAASAALLLVLVACSNGDGESEMESRDVQDALDEGGSLLVWGWGNAVPPMIDEFADEYPQVDIEFATVGMGGDHYTAVENAVAAGSGIPDVVVMEYRSVPQFALNGSLLELTPYGAGELDGVFTPGTWDGVHYDGGVYGLPMSSGPVALFYNSAIFDEHDLDVPETWEQYLDAARELNAADPDLYILADTAGASRPLAKLWQLGAQPFQVDGENITIDLESGEVDRYTELWQQFLDEELVIQIPGFSDEWYQGLSNGTIATVIDGATMPANLESGVEAGAGDWRVAPMPQWSEDEFATAEVGGASLGIMEASENPELAYAFLEWATAGDGVDVRINDTFPSTIEHLESEEYLSYEPEYFGGQRINEVLTESAVNVVEGWAWPPYYTYAHGIYADHVGPAYLGDITLQEGLINWQDALVTYGTDQGFSVNE